MHVEKRRIIGGYMWRDAVSRALRLEEEKIGVIRTMMEQTDNPDKLRAYGKMLAVTVEVVTILNELLRYSDKRGCEHDN